MQTSDDDSYNNQDQSIRWKERSVEQGTGGIAEQIEVLVMRRSGDCGRRLEDRYAERDG